MEITYTIGEVKEDKNDTVITASGMTREFPLSEIKQNIKTCEKAIREYDANAKLQDAIANNIYKNNTELIDKLTDQELNAVSMYFEAKKQLKDFTDKVKKLDELMGLELKDLERILEAYPELKDEPSAEVVEGEVKLNEDAKE